MLVLLTQARHYYGANPILRAAIDRVEGFQAAAPAPEVLPVMEAAGGDVSPSEANLQAPREPYDLLKGWLPAATDTAENPLSAQRCYDGDFQRRLERTGNYRQLTNNYKRGGPDSCSAPLQDLVTPFYKPEQVPDLGCLGKGE